MRRTSSRKDSLYEKITSTIRREPLRYKLKENHLLCLFLGIKFGPEFFVDMKRYILGLCQNYSTTCINDKCLYALLRVWIFSVSSKDIHNREYRVIDALRNSNPRDGWFELQRYSVEKIYQSNYISPSMEGMIQGLIQLFEKDSNWSPNSSYIYILALFFNFLDAGKFYANSVETSQRSMISDIKEQTK